MGKAIIEARREQWHSLINHQSTTSGTKLQLRLGPTKLHIKKSQLRKWRYTLYTTTNKNTKQDAMLFGPVEKWYKQHVWPQSERIHLRMALTKYRLTAQSGHRGGQTKEDRLYSTL